MSGCATGEVAGIRIVGAAAEDAGLGRVFLHLIVD
jgi:hypothetical protein